MSEEEWEEEDRVESEVRGRKGLGVCRRSER